MHHIEPLQQVIGKGNIVGGGRGVRILYPPTPPSGDSLQCLCTEVDKLVNGIVKKSMGKKQWSTKQWSIKIVYAQS